MKLIKPLLLAAIIGTMVPLTVNAQCKNVVTQEDPFTNKVIKTMRQVIGPVTWNWQIVMEKNGDEYQLGMQIVNGGKVNGQFNKGDIIYIKFENGEVFQYVCAEDFAPNYQAAQGYIWTSFQIKQPVDKKIIAKFTKSAITDIKVTLDGNDVILPKINKKQTAKVIEGAQCLLGN